MLEKKVTLPWSVSHPYDLRQKKKKKKKEEEEEEKKT